jgi:PhnB protein
MSRPDQFIPHLIVSDGMAAIEFYKAAFGVEQGHTAMGPDGKRVMHGDLSMDGHRFFISDEFSAEEGGSLKSPQTLGGTSGRITLEVDDAEAVVARAAAAGARVLMPVADMFWGARYGKILDPFGHEWGINQQQKEMSDEELKAQEAAFMASRSKDE